VAAVRAFWWDQGVTQREFAAALAPATAARRCGSTRPAASASAGWRLSWATATSS
jgi:hypothetical protein